MPFEVRLARAARKQLDGLPRGDYLRLHEKLKDLAAEPRPAGAIQLAADLYRIRSGPYRALYSILEKERVVLVVKVARRSEKTYRDLP